MSEPYDREKRDTELRALIVAHRLDLHDVWVLGMILAEAFQGMIKFTGKRVVLHIKHERTSRKRML